MRAFLAVLLLCFTMQLGAQAKTLRVAVDEYYPPFSYLDEQTGQYTGFDVEIAKALCFQAGLDCQIVPVKFDNVFKDIGERKIDIGVLGLGKSEERNKLVIFTNRYFRSSSVFIEIPGTVEISEEGLRGKKIGVQKNSVQEEYLNKTYAGLAEIVTFAGFDELMEALKTKAVHVALVDGLPVYYKLMNEHDTEFDFVGEPIRLTDDSFIVLHPSLTKERDLLNKAIEKIRASGEYDKINRKYFNFNIY